MNCFVAFCGFGLILTANLVDGIQMQNVAQNGNAQQSDGGTDAEKAIDGRKNPQFYDGFCSLVPEQKDPWWRVDLTKMYPIHSVVITSSNMTEYNLSGIRIWIGNTSSNALSCGSIRHFPRSRSFYRPCGGTQAHFVTLILPGFRNLSLCEVKVYTTDFTYPQHNVAVKGQAVQSSTLYPASANRAIDGRRDSFYSESSCSHTQEETAPWWRVDLGQTFTVSSVKVTNRGDCCPQRLDGAQIRIGNSLQNNGNNNIWCANVSHIPPGQTWTFTCASAGVDGRYVNLVLPGDGKILTLCEVEVYAQPTVRAPMDVAQGKPVRSEESNTLWSVDLGAVVRVSAVVFYTRRDIQDIVGAKILIGKSRTPGRYPVCATVSSTEQEQAFYCSEAEGQYVSVKIPNATNLTVYRVEVYGSQ